MTRLLTELVVDRDFGQIRSAIELGTPKFRRFEMVGDVQEISVQSSMQYQRVITNSAPSEANAYMIGSVSDPQRKRGTDEWSRFYWVQFYKAE